KLCGKDSWFLPFNKGVNDGAGNPVNKNGLKTSYLWEDILTKERLSDILEHYAQVIEERDNDTGKWKEKVIWPRWHQLEVVRNLLSDTKSHEVGQRYLIQHSAGSGKSNSITWLAYQLVELLQNSKLMFDSIIVVTDRVNLDKQLCDNIQAFKHNRNIVGRAESSRELCSLLKDGKKIVLTTVQKFPFILDAVGSDLADKQFAVIIDEAHSSQSGRMSAMQSMALNGVPKDDEDEVNDIVEKFMKARHIASNANFYAFTATPKNKTLEMFGTPFPQPNGETGHRPFHVYSMKQAIEEGFILDVLKYYTTYDSFYHIQKKIEDDPKFDEKQAMKKLRFFVESQPETVEKKAKIIVEHFHKSIAQKIGGEARCMICTVDIERVIDYFYAVKKLLEERKSPYKAIVAFSGNHKYHGKLLTEGGINGFRSDEIEKKFRTGNYRFLIVADKFQTGYDEPLLHTMYLDKELHGVQTVQTLSRLNRTHPKKVDTCVLDFANTYESVESDFQMFYKTTILSKETDPNKLNDLLDTIENYGIYTENEVEEVNNKYWEKASRTEIDPLLDRMKERFCKLEKEDQVECKGAIKTYIRTYEFLATIMMNYSLEWEKKQTVLKLLLNKLPSLGMDDLTQGLIDAVDLDRYRLEKNKERAIELKNEDKEILPVPTTINPGYKPDLQNLSEIELHFNELFGNIDWRDEDLVRKQVNEIVERVTQDDSVRNSMLNSDLVTAYQDCDEQVDSQMADSKATYTQLMDYYWKNHEFKESLNEFIREKVRNAINPEYDEEDLKERMRDEFQNDFSDICDGVNYVKFDEVLNIFFRIVNAETIPDLQDLKSKLRHILNCLYRAQHREVDFRTWYTQLVTRFDTFLKK
ncbi:MAG: DEAD/DEAH box helicase family protein, partial [Prevotella sp.]|nr:DEAD/DEAH box helicase family protein [Prevotella sp.]